MLPPADYSLSAGTRAGPACPCTLKPLPCLVDTWVTGNSVPYEQPLSIQTDMEYTLDTRLFPGWDPVTGQTQPALVIDAAVLTARSQAAAAPPTMAMPGIAASSSMAPTCTPMPRTRASTAGGLAHSQRDAAAATTATHVQQVEQHTRSRYRHAATARGGLHASRTPATPAELPPTPAASYHPAFRPTEAHFRPTPPQFRQHRPLQPPDAVTALPQHPQPNTADNDLLALIASIDVEPAGYQLDVDWLIGHHQAAPSASAAAAAYSATQLASVTPHHHHHHHHHLLHHHHHHQHPHPHVHPHHSLQRVAPCPAPLPLPPHAGLGGMPPTFATDLTDYQRQFYPGASWGGNGGGIIGTSGTGAGMIGGTSGTCTSGAGLMNTTAVLGGFLQTRGIAPQVVVVGGGKSRSSKRRLPVDSPCEGAVPAVVIDLTQSPNPKRARWTGGWTGVYGPGGLGVTHVPSPLQNRAY